MSSYDENAHNAKGERWASLIPLIGLGTILFFNPVKKQFTETADWLFSHPRESREQVLRKLTEPQTMAAGIEKRAPSSATPLPK